ncbi:unnamed protein product [Rotaria magnacalcarata]|uniref:Uncharacterized protein n=1 Tax=Rotaria magnacalcarata TaxID=392030 RepID=A0A8S3EAQ5_9BILA|nr:unnamed protein product [Rotaria magnacalcarata]
MKATRNRNKLDIIPNLLLIFHLIFQGDKGYCYIPYNYVTNIDYCFDVWTVRQLATDDYGQDHWDNTDSVDYQQSKNSDDENNNDDNHVIQNIDEDDDKDVAAK